jgi:FADH2 O2-dependent halogenase
LPHTAGFIDPLHSTGIAQTLCGIERLAPLLAAHWDQPSLSAELENYGRTLATEITFVDRLVSACYATRRDFRQFISCAMLYFAAATTYERRRLRGELRPGAAFLCADDEELRRLVSDFWERAQALARSRAETIGEAEIAAFESDVASAIAPFNQTGLCDPAAHNMYRYTALPA